MPYAPVTFYAQSGPHRVRLDFTDGDVERAEAVCEVAGCTWSTTDMPWQRDLNAAATDAVDHLHAEHL